MNRARRIYAAVICGNKQAVRSVYVASVDELRRLVLVTVFFADYSEL